MGWCIKNIPMAEESRVIMKNIKEKAIPTVGFWLMRDNPYRKVNSLAPTPPMVSGNTATIEETRKSVRKSISGGFWGRAFMIKNALIN